MSKFNFDTSRASRSFQELTNQLGLDAWTQRAVVWGSVSGSSWFRGQRLQARIVADPFVHRRPLFGVSFLTKQGSTPEEDSLSYPGHQAERRP